LQTEQAAGKRPQPHLLPLAEIHPLHGRGDLALSVLLDDQQVDEPDYTTPPYPPQFGQDARCLL
jgi:hypothetical protein